MTNKHVYMGDILAGIFSHFPEDRKRFIYDEEKFQRFFFERRDGYPSLLGDKPFQQGMIYPKSDEAFPPMK